VFSNPTEEFLAFGRSRCPYRLEVGTWPTTDLHVGVDLAVGTLVEVKIGLVTQVKVRAIPSTARDVDQTVDRV
jgi:hypothetical protein